jgi:uncharacterized membrane protein (DUF2068 family)
METTRGVRAKYYSDLWLLVIGAFKLVKCVLLLVTALASLQLLHGDSTQLLVHWTKELHFDPSNRYIHHVIRELGLLDERRLELLGIGSLFYAVLFFIEGLGLLLRKVWAEYLTAFITATFIPFEILELVKRFTAVRLTLVLLNGIIVVYLVVRIMNQRRAAQLEGHPELP